MPSVLISSEIGSEWRIIMEHPQLTECMGICVLSLAHGSELRDSDACVHIVKNKKKTGIFSLNSPRARALGWFLLRFGGGGSLWGKSFIGNT